MVNEEVAPRQYHRRDECTTLSRRWSTGSSGRLYTHGKAPGTHAHTRFSHPLYGDEPHNKMIVSMGMGLTSSSFWSKLIHFLWWVWLLNQANTIWRCNFVERCLASLAPPPARNTALQHKREHPTLLKALRYPIFDRLPDFRQERGSAKRVFSFRPLPSVFLLAYSSPHGSPFLSQCSTHQIYLADFRLFRHSPSQRCLLSVTSSTVVDTWPFRQLCCSPLLPRLCRFLFLCVGVGRTLWQDSSLEYDDNLKR